MSGTGVSSSGHVRRPARLAAMTVLAMTLLTMTALAMTLLAVTPAGALAQRAEAAEGDRPSAVRGYAGIGWAQVDLDELNARLAAQPVPYGQFPEDVLTIGGGAHVRLGRFLVGGEVQFLAPLDRVEAGDVRRATLSGFTMALTTGWAVVATPALDVYPLIQLGGGGWSLDVEERASHPFDDVLNDPGRSAVMSAGTFYGAAGLGVDYAFARGFLLGLRGTWGVSPSTDDWTAEGDDVLGGPDVDLSGPRLRVLIGWGGRGRR